MINLLNVFKVKSKCSLTSFRCIYCWPWLQSTYEYSISTFNFKEPFVNSVRKTSHNVPKKKKRDICIVIKVARPILFKGLSLHRIERSFWIFDNTSALNLLKVCYPFVPLFDLLYHRYFTEFFLLYLTENLFKSLKQWNKLVGI